MSPADFRFRRPVEVRFRDLDPMGHAHHSLPLIYFEEARAAYWREVAGRDGIDYLLAEVRVSFHERIRFPAALTVGLRTTHIGRKSFRMQYAVFGAGEKLLASGESVQVMYDYGAQTSEPVPDEVRERIRAFEGLS